MAELFDASKGDFDMSLNEVLDKLDRFPHNKPDCKFGWSNLLAERETALETVQSLMSLTKKSVSML